MVFDPDGAGNRARKQPHPIDVAEFGYDDWTARIGEPSIDDRSAHGAIADGSARWGLRITPGTAALVGLLTERGWHSSTAGSTSTTSRSRWRAGRAALGPVLLPSARCSCSVVPGTEFAVRSVPDSLHTHGRYRSFAWTFGGRVGEQMIGGEITAESGDVIGLTYTDTDGGSKFCYNSAIATCRVQLAGKAFERAELVATRRAMFEILTDTREDAVPLLA
jgi:hypothetical protein